MKINRSVFGACAILLLHGSPAAPQTLADDGSSAPAIRVATEVLTEPNPKKMYTPNYPLDELRRNGEGWVHVGFMIDPSGKPLEVTVVDSSGNKVFEKTALETIERSTFEPGRVNGRPVESAFNMNITFMVNSGRHGASDEFVAAYRRLTASVKAKNRTEADDAMKHLRAEDLYEDAYYGLALFEYAHAWGTPAEELHGLNRALKFESAKSHYLPSAEVRSALIECMNLLLQQHHYGEVLDLWKRLDRSGLDAKTTHDLTPIIVQLNQLRANDLAYDIPSGISDGNWHLKLFKRHFRVTVKEGRLYDVNLRCEKGFVRFDLDQDLLYTVEEKYGDCSMEFQGEHGTQFILTQS